MIRRRWRRRRYRRHRWRRLPRDSLYYRLKLYCCCVTRPTRPGCERSTRPSVRKRAPSLHHRSPKRKARKSTQKCHKLQQDVSDQNRQRVLYDIPTYTWLLYNYQTRFSRGIYREYREFIGNDDVQRRRIAVVSPAGQSQQWRRWWQPKPADNNGHRLSDAAVAVSRQGLCVVRRLQDLRRRASTATTALRHHRRCPEPRHQLLSRSVFQKVCYNNNIIIIYDDVDRYVIYRDGQTCFD